jgi:hypothetical protein
MSGTGVAISFIHATRRFVRFRRVRNKCSVNAEALNKEKTCDATGEHETRRVECVGLTNASFLILLRDSGSVLEDSNRDKMSVQIAI